ncbi:MAG: hypothetical protein IID34_14810 [Planctomycetes bacterium]|nr:hypothetical protein [Planctomycetota bacterium]
MNWRNLKRACGVVLLGGTMFAGCNTLIDFPGGVVDVNDDGVFVKFLGFQVDVTSDHVFIDVPGVEITVRD